MWEWAQERGTYHPEVKITGYTSLHNLKRGHSVDAFTCRPSGIRLGSNTTSALDCLCDLGQVPSPSSSSPSVKCRSSDSLRVSVRVITLRKVSRGSGPHQVLSEEEW